MWLSVLALATIPATAGAQTIANSFEELRSQLAGGQVVVVMDAAGHRTTGKLSNVSPRSFEVVTKKGQTQTFGEGKLTAFWKDDGLGNGVESGMEGALAFDLLLTLAVGRGRDVPLAQFFAGGAILLVPAGMGIGAAVDSLFHHKELHVDYRPAPVKKTTIYVAPLADARRRGVSLSIRY